MFRHGIVHEGIVFVADNSSSIGDLSDVSGSVTLVGTTAMPNLIVKHSYAACFAQIVLDFIFPFCVLSLRRWTGSEEVGSGDGFGSSMFNFCDVG